MKNTFKHILFNKKILEDDSVISESHIHRYQYNMKKNLILCILLSIIMIVLCGCVGSGKSSSSSTVSASEEVIDIVLGAPNKMANDALTLTVLDVQRRPVSIFQGASSSEGTVGIASTNNIVIELDVQITYNPNTLMSTTGENVQTLSELLMPGSLMYIQGRDQNGEPYFSSSIITPGDVSNSALGLEEMNSHNYNILGSALPGVSQTARGSILFEVSSLVEDLELLITTANGAASATDPALVQQGNHIVYRIDLS